MSFFNYVPAYVPSYQNWMPFILILSIKPPEEEGKAMFMDNPHRTGTPIIGREGGIGFVTSWWIKPSLYAVEPSCNTFGVHFALQSTAYLWVEGTKSAAAACLGLFLYIITTMFYSVELDQYRQFGNFVVSVVYSLCNVHLHFYHGMQCKVAQILLLS